MRRSMGSDTVRRTISSVSSARVSKLALSTPRASALSMRSLRLKLSMLRVSTGSASGQYQPPNGPGVGFVGASSVRAFSASFSICSFNASKFSNFRSPRRNASR